MTAIVVLARQSSQRLPLKHLYPIAGTQSALEVLLGRISNLGRSILACGGSDKLYHDLGHACGWEVYQSGFVHDENVLERLWRASIGSDPIVMVNGDSPLVGPDVIEMALSRFRDLDFLACSGPSGMRVRVISAEGLKRWYQWTKEQTEKPLSGLALGPGLACDSFTFAPSSERFTIDDYEDVKFIRALCKELGPDRPAAEYIEYQRDHPYLRPPHAQAGPGVGGSPTEDPRG